MKQTKTLKDLGFIQHSFPHIQYAFIKEFHLHNNKPSEDLLSVSVDAHYFLHNQLDYVYHYSRTEYSENNKKLEITSKGGTNFSLILVNLAP